MIHLLNLITQIGVFFFLKFIQITRAEVPPEQFVFNDTQQMNGPREAVFFFLSGRSRVKSPDEITPTPITFAQLPLAYEKQNALTQKKI